MAIVTLRQSGANTTDITYKNAPLTNNEVDANFKNLADKLSTGTNLDDIANLATTNNYFIVGNGTGFSLESPSSARTSLGLGTIATQASNNVSITGGSISGLSSLSTTGNATIGGNLTVNGTTITVNSTTVTVDDPIFTLAGDTSPTTNDGKDRGIEFRYFDVGAKIGFMGWDNSTDKFVLLTSATNTSEVFTGTKAELDANVAYSNITGTPTIGNGAMTVTAGSGLSGGGQLGTANQTGSSSIAIAHADTSSVSDLTSDNSGGTFIQDISLTFDTFGHVTGASVATGTVGDGALSVAAGDGLVGGGQIGTVNQSGNSSVTISHADTSSVSNLSSDNSGNTFIQDISFTFDTFGHVTGASVATGTVNQTDFTIRDGDGTDVSITDSKFIQFIEGSGIDINWTDTSTGSTGDPYDLTIASTDTLALVTGRGATTATNCTFSGGINLSSSNITNGGTITATDFNSSSDINLKDNITAIENPLAIVEALSGVNFTWKDNGKEAIGVIAQEVEKVLPQIVKTNLDGYKSVSYDSLIPVLIEAIKELAAKVK